MTGTEECIHLLKMVGFAKLEIKIEIESRDRHFSTDRPKHSHQLFLGNELSTVVFSGGLDTTDNNQYHTLFAQSAFYPIRATKTL